MIYVYIYIYIHVLDDIGWYIDKFNPSSEQFWKGWCGMWIMFSTLAIYSLPYRVSRVLPSIGLIPHHISLIFPTYHIRIKRLVIRSSSVRPCCVRSSSQCIPGYIPNKIGKTKAMFWCRLQLYEWSENKWNMWNQSINFGPTFCLRWKWWNIRLCQKL